MSDAERYQQAARRASTARRYAQAIEHFEGEWGGLLPASSVSVVHYLAAYGARLSASTLRTHLAALAQWHQQRGFADPTKAAQVRDTLRGIQALHPQPVKQAPALQLKVLETSIEGLSADVHSALPALRLRAARDQALILLGFWRAFRGDELCRLQADHVRIEADEGMQLFLPSSKTDRDNRGRILTMPALKRLCPVQATEQWLTLSGIARVHCSAGLIVGDISANSRSTPTACRVSCAGRCCAAGSRQRAIRLTRCVVASPPGPAAIVGAVRH